MPRKVVSNPFGDDDSDESDDGFNNPFATKKAKPVTTTNTTTTTTNTVKSKAKNPNPFMDDDSDDIPTPKPLVTAAPAPLPRIASFNSNNSHNNPFDDDDDVDDIASSDFNNPFASSTIASTTNDNNNGKKLAPANNDTRTKFKPPSKGFTAHFEPDTNPFGNTDNDVFANSNTGTAPAPNTAPVKAKASTAKTKITQGQGQGHHRSQTVGPGTGSTSTKNTTANNPMEFADFGSATNTNINAAPKVKKSIFGRRKTASDSNGKEPMAQSVDQDGGGFGTSNGLGAGAGAISGLTQDGKKTKATGVAFDASVTAGGEGKMSKPGFLGRDSRSKSDGAALKNNLNSSLHGTGTGSTSTGSGWLRGNKVAAVEEVKTPKKKKSGGASQAPSSMSKSSARTGAGSGSGSGGTSANKSTGKQKKTKKNVIMQCWPYDDFHKDQQKYYENISERDVGMGSPSRRRGADEFGYNSGSDEDDMDMHGNGHGHGNGHYNGHGHGEDVGVFARESIFERPSDLPSINEAVQNLSLLDFENKAEERAITIVSTWLFDAGLIDELLVNGASGYGQSSASIGGGQSTSIVSVKSSEGVEVGAHGFPLEGGLKIDKEAEKLRAGTQRELTLINTRLNDGVAASGSEVQELVNAVSATKSELGRLRELATYISSGYKRDGNSGSQDAKDGLLLAEYPRLKRAINARRNIFRCFRELEFFSQIPLTCDRLREELHQGEWTANEWNTIRDVCMEHVELEILLVEAESGMKAWLDDEEDGDDDSSMPSIQTNRSLKKSWKGRQAALLAGNHQVVDNFLSQHVKNVWELGDEIRMRILSGVGSAFDLALQNPAGMVALVEAVEVYERAAEQYKVSQGYGDEESVSSDKNHLRFTDMRAAALAQLYQDFELRGLEVFRAIHMQAADLAEEDDALSHQFNAVLRAATELVTEIDVVKNQMAPCFAPHWHVEILWSSCVAHVCSNQIVQQIGGPDGQQLPELSVTQLLDLVAWVEFFRETIEDAFPVIGTINAKKTYFDERPDLFAGNEKVVNMENAKDSLAWVNNMLWEVHRLAQDEFLLRTRSETDKWITKVYNANHETTQTREGRLVTSLCEDIFSLAGIQLRTIRERLTKKSDALVMAVCLIFSQLRAQQLQSRDKFMRDLETCCASANDFQRMSEKVEDVVQELIDHSELPETSVQMLEDSCGALVSLYSGDAVYAAQRAHCFIFEPIEEAIGRDLFGRKWEVELTHNELAMTLTRTLVSMAEKLACFFVFVEQI